VALLAVTIACAGVGIIGGQKRSHALSSEFTLRAFVDRRRRALGIGRIDRSSARLWVACCWRGTRRCATCSGRPLFRR
jgi:hypothetical protein